MTALIGNWRALDNMIEGLRQVARAERHRELLTELGHDALDLVDEGFAGAHGPDGTAWARKVIPDGNPPGTRSGAARASYGLRRLTNTTVTVGPAGAPRRYLRYLQGGRGPVTAKRAGVLRFTAGGTTFFRRRVGPAPARPVVPSKGAPLPRPWADRFNATAQRWFRQTVFG